MTFFPRLFREERKLNLVFKPVVGSNGTFWMKPSVKTKEEEDKGRLSGSKHCRCFKRQIHGSVELTGRRYRCRRSVDKYFIWNQATMSSVQYLREFVSERLSAAAEEILRVVEITIVEYEKEIDRQRRLLDIVWKPEIKLHRVGV